MQPETFNIPAVAKQALSVYRVQPLQFMLIALVGGPVHLVVIEAGFLTYIWSIVSLGLGELVFAALTYAAASAHAGTAPDVVQSYRIAASKLTTLLELLIRQLGAALLLAITIVGIPLAIRVLVRWFFGSQAVVLNDISAKEAISLSCRLVTGRWWQLAGTIVLISVIFGTPGLIATIIWWPYSTASLIISSVLSVIFGPFVASFWALLYLDLRDRTTAVVVAP